MKGLFILLTLVSVLGCQGQTKNVSQKQKEETKQEKVEITRQNTQIKEETPEQIRQKDYDLFKSYFKKEIELPVSFKSPANIIENDTISKELYNKVIWFNQDENDRRAKVYELDKDTLAEVRGYGILDNKTSNLSSVEYHTRIYPLGYINFNKNFECFVLEIRNTMNVYIEGYVFDKKGNIKSLMFFYEEASFIKDYSTRGKRDDEYEKLIESSVGEDKIVKLFMKENGVSQWIDCKLETDGYFKPISYKEEGEYWGHDNEQEE